MCHSAYLKGACKRAGNGPFTRACSHNTRGNGFKLKEGRFRLDIRKKFFTMRVLRHWHRLPREALSGPSLGKGGSLNLVEGQKLFLSKWNWEAGLVAWSILSSLHPDLHNFFLIFKNPKTEICCATFHFRLNLAFSNLHRRDVPYENYSPS